MRAVEDHHVDRPEVEAQQCVQLTGTNRSIGLITLNPPVLPNWHQPAFAPLELRRGKPTTRSEQGTRASAPPVPESQGLVSAPLRGQISELRCQKKTPLQI